MQLNETIDVYLSTFRVIICNNVVLFESIELSNLKNRFYTDCANLLTSNLSFSFVPSDYKLHGKFGFSERIDKFTQSFTQSAGLQISFDLLCTYLTGFCSFSRYERFLSFQRYCYAIVLLRLHFYSDIQPWRFLIDLQLLSNHRKLSK